MMAGAGAPMAESGAVGALGGKPPQLGAVESSKILPEELAGHTRSQIPDLAVDKGPGQSAEDVASGTAATEQTAPAVVEGGLSANGPTGKYYSVVREHKLRPESYPGVSRPAHNQEANEAFLRDMAGYDDYARDMRNFGIYLWRTPTGLAPRTPPAGFSWHHHLEEPGLLQLVPRKQHDRGSIFQDVLHPNGRGGYSKWGK
jgi:A nuclease of the HNH/ENDO VII superfamily with conserved WHH